VRGTGVALSSGVQVAVSGPAAKAAKGVDSMAANELFTLLASDELFFDHDEVASGFRDHRGSTSAGRFEDDPEMLEYEDLVELGESLSAW